jgi:hypothetical protein
MEFLLPKRNVQKVKDILGEKLPIIENLNPYLYYSTSEYNQEINEVILSGLEDDLKFKVIEQSKIIKASRRYYIVF